MTPKYIEDALAEDAQKERGFFSKSKPPGPPRVFVVQQPAFYDRSVGKFMPKYDLTAATKHGQLIYMLGPGNIFKDRMTQATRQLAVVLETFSEDDFILAVGDPVAIAAAVLIAGQRTGGRIKLLKWDRISSAYEAFPIITH